MACKGENTYPLALYRKSLLESKWRIIWGQIVKYLVCLAKELGLDCRQQKDIKDGYLPKILQVIQEKS